MRALAAGLVVVALASAACAGGNPDVTFYMSFSPDEKVFAITPDPYTYVDAYLFLGSVESGVYETWFRINVWEEYPGVLAPNYMAWKIWPGEGWYGDLETGMYVGSTSCEYGPEEHFLSLNFFYVGGSCCIRLLEHPDYPRWVSDCDGGLDYWCVESHASIGGEICPDGDCPQSPVQAHTWGAMKALYR